MENPRTCGTLYLEGLRAFSQSLAEDDAFAAGFVSGQAEKVMLGASSAAMFRPSAERYSWLLATVAQVADRYGLYSVTIETSVGKEIWLCRSNQIRSMIAVNLASVAENGETWHRMRAQLCGVPDAEVDVQFHERQGYGQVCDQVEDSRV